MENLEQIRQSVMERLLSGTAIATIVEIIVGEIMQGHKCTDLISLLLQIRQGEFTTGDGVQDESIGILRNLIGRLRGVCRWEERYRMGDWNAITGAREAAALLIDYLHDSSLVIRFLAYVVNSNTTNVSQQERPVVFSFAACEAEIKFIADHLERVRTMVKKGGDLREAKEIAFAYYRRGYSRDQTAMVVNTLFDEFLGTDSIDAQEVLTGFYDGLTRWCAKECWIWPPDIEKA